MDFLAVAAIVASPLNGDASQLLSVGVLSVLDGTAGNSGSESTDGLAFVEADPDIGCVVALEMVAEPVMADR